MANVARQDQQKRTIEVNREKLVEILESNKIKHLKDYEEAKEGYKETLLTKLSTAFDDAKKQLEDRYSKIKEKVSNFTNEDIEKQTDYFQLVKDITVTMPVPRSYEEEYNAAIDMAKWDVRETLELTYAEFNCFVRDNWDWKAEFENVSVMYKFKG